VPILNVDKEAVGLGNSLETIHWAVAASMPLFAAGKSQFRSKAVRRASARDSPALDPPAKATGAGVFAAGWACAVRSHGNSHIARMPRNLSTAETPLMGS
jgi:hypothetical protein